MAIHSKGMENKTIKLSVTLNDEQITELKRFMKMEGIASMEEGIQRVLDITLVKA